LLEADFEQLNNVEVIKKQLINRYYQDQIGVLHNLNEIKVSLQKIVHFLQNIILCWSYIPSNDDIASEMNRSAES
jgi:DNA repair protein RecN (Recombination protein N)